MARYGREYLPDPRELRAYFAGMGSDYGFEFRSPPRPRTRPAAYDRPMGMRAFGPATRHDRALEYRPPTHPSRGRYDRAYPAPEGPFVGNAWPLGTPARPRFGTPGRRAGAVRAGDIMTEDPAVVTADETAAEAARKMRELDVGIIPVVDDLQNRHLQGVITDRDLALRVVADGRDPNIPVGDAMTRRVESCGPEATVQEVLAVMRRERVRRVPVTDRDGRLVGVVAQADLALGYAGFDRDREIEVEATIRRISAPGRPRRDPASATYAW